MYNNTVSENHTHFVCGAQLINEAVKEYRIPNENWCYPLRHFGNPKDPYYSEIWTNGMDYTMNVWLIETGRLENPKAYPLLIFDSNEDEDRFNTHDLNHLLDACMGYRRMVTWFQVPIEDVQQQSRRFCYFANESAWNWLTSEEVRNPSCPDLVRCHYAHTSQLQVSFWLNDQILDFKSLRVKQTIS